MERILSAIFDNRRDADAAIAELVLTGFPRTAIRLGSGDPDEQMAAPGAQPGDPSGRAGAIAAGRGNNFFDSLFGTDKSVHVQGIDGAVTHSHLVLTVALPSLTEVERAAAIVERYGPLDIDSIIAGAPDLQRANGAVVDGGDEQAQRMAPANAAEAFPGDPHYDEYAPAYLYGLDMATHEQHGGKQWHEAEPDLRDEWERRHPHSAWDSFKHAARRGWDKLRGGPSAH